MNFKNNASKFFLLTNEPIKFWDDNGNSFLLFPPSLKSLYTNEDIMFCISLLEKDLNELKTMINIKINSIYKFLHLVFSLSKKVEEFNIIMNNFISGFKEIIPKFNFDKMMKIDNVVLNEETFNCIVDVILLSLDKKITRIEKDDDEFTRREKEAKLRADRIRRNSKNNSKGTDIEDIIAAILYEFPQYKIDDIMKMNLYTIYFLFKQVGRIANYEINQIAMGNGLLKSNKFKYFIEK